MDSPPFNWKFDPEGSGKAWIKAAEKKKKHERSRIDQRTCPRWRRSREPRAKGGKGEKEGGELRKKEASVSPKRAEGLRDEPAETRH